MKFLQVVVFASMALATDLHFQIMKRMNVDPRAVTGATYECHANCGYAIQDAESLGCESSKWLGYIEACEACAATYDIWKYYGSGVSAATSSCGITITTSASSAVATATTTDVTTKAASVTSTTPSADATSTTEASVTSVTEVAVSSVSASAADTTATIITGGSAVSSGAATVTVTGAVVTAGANSGAVVGMGAAFVAGLVFF